MTKQPPGQPRPRAGRVLLLIAALLFLAARPALAQRRTMRLYDEDSGLFNGSITALARDRTGLLLSSASRTASTAMTASMSAT